MIAQRNRRRAKKAEKAVAEIMGGVRVGIMGGEDVSCGKFSVEVKSRKKFTAEKWFLQSCKNAKGKIPIVVIHVTGKHHDNDYVMMRLKDFMEVTNEDKQK